jgi:DNA-binding CsgD family transcriptional regulator
MRAAVRSATLRSVVMDHPIAGDLVDRGRRSALAGAWANARAELAEADEHQPLAASDLELLATCCFMVGGYDEWIAALERAHASHLDAGETRRAVRCAFWIGTNCARRGEMARASGWLGRAQRLLERETEECVEHGYLLMPQMFQHEAEGDLQAAADTAETAARIGERYGDSDLFALAVMAGGELLIKQGRVKEGLATLDEAMVAITTQPVSPIVAGLVYCGVIAGCQQVYELSRAQEWTAALSEWCASQPQLQAFTGTCRVHRAEILQLHGEWSDALEEATQARLRLSDAADAAAIAQAFYRQGEVHRLMGELAAAERAYRQASRSGWEPQPGLALVRLAQGDVAAADAAIRRAVGETGAPLQRARLLPAYVEILLAAGDTAEARIACGELAAISDEFDSDMLRALAARAVGMVDLSEGDASAALIALRRSWRLWQKLGAPYEAASVRVQVALACRMLDDHDAFAMELDAARAVFEQLNASPDIARVAALTGRDERHGLTGRELEVLRLVAAGQSNRKIAEQLVISEHTVARHVQNILAKLEVPTRTAAGAFAFTHGII